jgi:hypothetical protein
MTIEPGVYIPDDEAEYGEFKRRWLPKEHEALAAALLQYN